MNPSNCLPTYLPSCLLINPPPILPTQLPTLLTYPRTPLTCFCARLTTHLFTLLLTHLHLTYPPSLLTHVFTFLSVFITHLVICLLPCLSNCPSTTSFPASSPIQKSVGKIYVNNSLYLALKYVQIFVSGYHLFQDANSFPRADLEES